MNLADKIRYILRKFPDARFNRGEFMWRYCQTFLKVKDKLNKDKFMEFWKQEAGLERQLRIEKEDNLSQKDNCWVYGDAWVYGDLKLIGGYFYHTKEKSEEIERVEVSEDYELLCREPKLESEEPKTGKKVRIKLSDNQIVEGELIKE